MAQIETAAAGDLASIGTLLESAGLPTSDLLAARPRFVVIREQGRIVAAGALERCGASAVLRSLIVAADRRSGGLGSAILLELERVARSVGIQQLVLLTQTAAAFFGLHGYSVIARSAAPSKVQHCEEFRTLCPDSATCMAKVLTERVYNVLFLCTGNSARSILAEALLNRWGQGRFRGFSAGSHPKGAVHPLALELLQRMNLPTEGLRSKSWDVFAAPEAAAMDFIFTVCDNAAGEVCPYWPGQPMTAHWGIPDPAAVEESDSARWAAFRSAFQALESRIKLFMSLPLTSLDRMSLQERLSVMGQVADRAPP